MNRITLERWQVWIYLAAIMGGLFTGSLTPAIAPAFERMLWPLLILLLYATFVQVPLLHVRDAFRDQRFLGAVFIGNFILIPLIIWVMLLWVPDYPALRLGILLVLLVPCTDWFITFSQLGGGNILRAIAVTPVNLLLQLLLLPVYLWLLLDSNPTVTLSLREIWPALLVIFIPLLMAGVSEYWIEARTERSVLREKLACWPVPLLALVVFLIAGAQVKSVHEALGVLPVIVPIFTAFLLFAALVAKLLAKLMQLPTEQGRTLAFSLGTRNSFIVLPIGLTLPTGWEMVAVVIVIQSLVELLGMVFYLWWIPRHLFR